MLSTNNNSDINEQVLVPITELPFQYNNTVISNTIKITEQKEKMLNVKNQKKENNMEIDKKKNQHSIEQWFLPNNKKRKNQQENEKLNSNNSVLIDLTEYSEGSDSHETESIKNMNEEIIDQHNSNIDQNAGNRTPTRDSNNKRIVKSPYFLKEKENTTIDKKNNIMKKKVIELIDSSSGGESDSENTIDIIPETQQNTEQDSEQDTEVLYSDDEKKEELTKKKNFEILVIEKEINKEETSIIIKSDKEEEQEKQEKEKKQEVQKNDNQNDDELIKSRLRSLRSRSSASSNSSIDINSVLNNKSVVDEPASLTDDGAEADDENENTTKSKRLTRELNNLELDINNEKKDISSTSFIVNGRSLRKRPSKETSPKIIQIKDTSTPNLIKKKVNQTKEAVIFLNGSPNKKITSYLTPNKKIQKIIINRDDISDISESESESESEDESESESNESESNEIKNETESEVIEVENENKKMPKKRRRQSNGSNSSRKKTKVELEPSEEKENENDKKVTYKQSSLQGFSKLPSPSVRSFKPRKKRSTPKVKKVLPIPEFSKLESHSVFDRYSNLVITDILKLLSISDFLEKFGDCMLELDQKINFYILYQAIVYPTSDSFKFLSNIYVALLTFLKGKEETSKLIIPLNELTWQYYLIPTITETLRHHYRIKRNTMYNYSLPDYLIEMESNEFYRISPLAHVKTLHQLIAVLADTPNYRNNIDTMIDKMMQLGNQRRIDIMERKNMEEEVNNLHRDVNIVGIRIKTLEIEIKKQKEKEKEEITKNKTRPQRNSNSNNNTIDHRSLSRLHVEYNKKVSALDKLKRTLKKKDDLISAKKKEKMDIKNKIFKGNERYLGIDRNNRYYWLVDIKYTPKKTEIEEESDDEKKEEKTKKIKPKSLLSFITKDEKGKLALNNTTTTDTAEDENIYGIVIEDCKRKPVNQENYYNLYYYYDDSILYDYSYEMISSTAEIKKLITTLQLDDYDEEILHANIIDFFSSRGYKIDSQTKLESSSSDINVETSLQNFKTWCEKLGKEAITKDEILVFNEKNVVMYLNKINEISFYLESNFRLPSITIILSDMANNDNMEVEIKNDENENGNENENKNSNEENIDIVDLDNYNKNHTLSYHPKHLRNITDKIKSLYTEHSDSVIHENKKNLNTKIIKNKLKGVELAIFNNNDIKLIIKKDKKEYVKFSEYQLEKIDDVNNLSELYSWFLEIKLVLDVKSNIISEGQKPKNNSNVQKGSHNLRERKKTNYNEIYHSDDDFM